jgi:ceramide glucosyltransferase
MSIAAVLGYAAAALSACGSVYTLAAGPVMRRYFRREPAPAQSTPAVSIFKPLHGAPSSLEDDLASFLAQEYAGDVQILFGVHGADDPAVAVVKRLVAAYPKADIDLVIDGRVHGANPKISNLVNMAPRAKHGLFLLSDSDIRVKLDFLGSVVAASAEPSVGAISCCYAGRSDGRFWSRFAAMDIDLRFLPNAVMGIASGLAHPCFGSAIALSRATYERIGGFASLKDMLADDYELGRAVRATGAKVSIPPVLVEHDFQESGLGEVWAHELRWARTVRTVDPLGHFGSALTYPLPWALAALFCLRFNLFAAGLVILALLSRMALKWHIEGVTARSSGPLWLLPLRDLMSFGVYLASLFGRSVQWQDLSLRVEREGTLSGS